MGQAAVIADASVLILLARAGHLPLLRGLFGSIGVPEPVRSELMAKQPPGAELPLLEAAFQADWVAGVRVEGKAVGHVKERFPNLGLGEAACLAAAGAAPGATLLLDDRHARQAASVLGLRVVGCLGILALAHHRGLLREKHDVAVALRALLAAGLWVGADVVEAFWEHLGGRP